ncbi:MAG: PqiC family protein [Puniceicoccales bacterium]|nr:PqiC family protein [Puniceicoccales bacterium]
MKIKTEIPPILLMVFMLSSGCTLFRATPDRTRLFDIGFRGEQSSALSVDYAAICLVLGHFPDHLDAPQIVTKIGEHELKSDMRYRWATPLSENILSIVRQSIQRDFPKASVFEFPKESTDKFDFTIRLDVDTLEIDEVNSRVTFAGAWIILSDRNERIERFNYEFQESFGGTVDRYGEMVAKLEQVILHLGAAIGRQLDLVLMKNRETDGKQT